MVEKNISETSSTEVLPRSAPLPPGVKRVREVSTRTEVYDESTLPPGESDIDPEDEDLGLMDELPEDPEPVAPTPLNQFLKNLEGVEDVTIYVRRKPDPPNTNFKNPSDQPIHTVGEIPYDDAMQDRESVDIAVQKTFKGGVYQIQVRRSGAFLKAWTTQVADPPEKTTVAVPHEAQPNNAQPPPLSFRAQMEELAATNKAVREALGIQSPARIAENNNPPPSDPLGDMGRSLVLDLTKKALENAVNPPAPVSTANNGEKSTAGEVLEYLRELGIAEMVKQGVLQIGLPMLAVKLRGGMMPQPPGNVGAPTPNPMHEQAAGVPPQSVPAGLPGQTAPTAAAVPAEAIEFVLRPLVTEMMADVSAGVGQDDYEYNTSGSVEAIVTVSQMAAEAKEFIEQNILAKSGVQLLVWLGEVNPEWKILQSTSDATDYAGWLNDLRIELREALAALSEPPAVAGGQSVTRETSEGESAEILNEISAADSAPESSSEVTLDVSRETPPASSPNVGAPTANINSQQTEPKPPRTPRAAKEKAK